MCEIFHNKQDFWVNDEFTDDHNRKVLKSTDRRNREFLAKIQQGDRSPIKFCDQYSIRDGKANNCNKIISQIFGKHLYSKEEMNRFIDKYSKQYQEDEENYKKEVALKWKENQELAEVLKKTQKMNCIFSNENNKIEEREETDIDLASIYLKEKPSIRTSYSNEQHFKEYLYFKQLVENKEKRRTKPTYHSQILNNLKKGY